MELDYLEQPSAEEQMTDRDIEKAPEPVEFRRSWQNESYFNPSRPVGMPRIRFTHDKAEAEAAAQADRSDIFHLPDAVVYVEPKEGREGSGKRPIESFAYDVENREGFQNVDYFNYEDKITEIRSQLEQEEYNNMVQQAIREAGMEAQSDAGRDMPAGWTPEYLEYRIETAKKALAHAQEQLDYAVEHNMNVMLCMQTVEAAQSVLDRYTEWYGKMLSGG